MMSRTRLVALLLTLALALAAAPAVLAQEEDPAADTGSTTAFDLSSIPEANQDEALILLHALREKLIAAGVSEGDVGAAIDSLEAEYGNLSEADMDELLAAQMLSDSEAETGDDEFGKAEEDEPELGDEEDEEE